MLNASAPNYRIWICQPGEDETTGFEVTEFCSGDSSGYLTLTSSPLSDERGVILASGQLTLDVPPFSNIFDPWETPDLWAIGNHVIVHVSDSSGTLRPLPLNHLYIIAEPKPPYPGHWILEVELGDGLTLKDSNKPTDNGLGLETSDRTQAVSALLGRAGLTFAGYVTGGNMESYQPNYNGSAVQQAGELAFGGYSALYQIGSGVIVSIPISFEREYRLFKHVVGVDDAADFEPLQSPIRPASEVEVVTTESGAEDLDDKNDTGSDSGDGGDSDKDKDRQKYRGSYESKELISRGAVAEGESEAEVIGTVRKQTWAWQGATYEQHVEEQRLRGLVVPEDLYLFLIQQGRDIVYPGPFATINALVYNETHQYESNKEGRRLSIRKESYKCLGEVLAEFYKKTITPNSTIPSFFSMFLAEVEETHYSYKKFDLDDTGSADSKGQVREIRTVKWLPRGQIAAAATDWITPGIAGPTVATGSTTLSPAEVTIESWRKRSSDEWEHKIQHYQAGRARTGTIKAFLRLMKTERSITETARNGNIRPPAAERRPGKEDKQRNRLTKPRRGKVTIGTASQSPRSRTVEVQNTESQEHNARLAAILGLLDKYRHQGFRITRAFGDEWFSWRPLARVDIDYKGYTYSGLLDATTFTFAANQAIVVCDCMKTGRQPAADNYPHPPLPALEPDDPNPEPLPSTEPITLYPFIPAATVIRNMVVQVRRRLLVRQLLHAVGPLPPSEMTVQVKRRLLVFERVNWQTQRRVVIEQVPLLEAKTRRRLLVTEQTTEAGLFAYYKLDSNTWADEVSGLNLTESNPLDPIPVVYDADEDVDCAEFGDSSSYLRRVGSAFSTRTRDSNWSWKVKFDLKLFDPDPEMSVTESIGDTELIAVTNEFTIFTKDIQLEIGRTWYDNEANVVSAGDPSAVYSEPVWGYYQELRVEVYTDHYEGEARLDYPTYLSLNTWHQIEVEYDAVNHCVTARVDGIAYSVNLEYPMTKTPTVDEFQVCYAPPYNGRMKELKFYETALVQRPN